jgi:hypothetical protein
MLVQARRAKAFQIAFSFGFQSALIGAGLRSRRSKYWAPRGAIPGPRSWCLALSSHAGGGATRLTSCKRNGLSRYSVLSSIANCPGPVGFTVQVVDLPASDAALFLRPSTPLLSRIWAKSRRASRDPSHGLAEVASGPLQRMEMCEQCRCDRPWVISPR